MDELVVAFTGETLALLELGKEGDNGGTRVTTDNGDDGVLGARAGDFGKETSGTDNVEGGDTEDAAGVVDTSFLEDLRDDGDGAVDGVGDDEDVGLGSNAADCRSEIPDNGSIGLKARSEISLG